MIDIGELVEELQRELSPHHDFALWTDDDWAEYAESALENIAQVRPEAFQRTAEVVLDPGVTQRLPKDAVRLMDVNSNVDAAGNPGRSVTRVDAETLDRFRPGWRQASGSNSITHYMWDERKPRQFEVYPPAGFGVSLEVSYVKNPPKVDPEDWPRVDLAAEYRIAMRHWMLYRAWSKDISSYGQQQAHNHYQWFYNTLNARTPMSQRVDPRTQDMPRRETDDD